jgi:hypothetical protein
VLEVGETIEGIVGMVTGIRGMGDAVLPMRCGKVVEVGDAWGDLRLAKLEIGVLPERSSSESNALSRLLADSRRSEGGLRADAPAEAERVVPISGDPDLAASVS